METRRTTPRSGSSPLARGLHHVPTRFRDHPGIIPARAGFTAVAGPCWHCFGDHPRSRGVYRGMAPGPVRFPGSSPLARGLRGPDSAHGAGPRDHPRSRGVYVAATRRHRWSGGSSPLARGLHLHQLVAQSLPGIIPARAGFTHQGQRAALRRRDHPRSRGVYRVGAVSGRAGCGSSPLARGLQTRGGGGVGTATDHPRSRGVYE